MVGAYLDRGFTYFDTSYVYHGGASEHAIRKVHNVNRYLYTTEIQNAHLFDHMKQWKAEGRIQHIAFFYHDDAAHMDQILTEHPEVEAVQDAKEAYRRQWKFNCADFSLLDDNAAGVPISGAIRAYNSLLLQPNPLFGAELNYYKSFRSAYDRSFETADYTAQTQSIGGAFDVNAALTESIAFLVEHSFQ